MTLNQEEFPIQLPIFVQNEKFIYPFMILPLFTTDKENIEAINIAMSKKSLIFVTTSNKEDLSDYYKVGVIGTIMRKVELPDGKIKILFQGLQKGQIKEQLAPRFAIIDKINPIDYNEKKVSILLDILSKEFEELSKLQSSLPIDLLKTINLENDPYRVSDLVLSALNLKINDTYKIFVENDIEKKLTAIIEKIIEKKELLNLQKTIAQEVSENVAKNNKEYMLRQQLKLIKKELGETNDKDEEIEEYKQKLNEIKPFISKKIYKEISKQINRFASMHSDSGEAGMIQNWIETVLEIPFGKYNTKKISIDAVEKRLNKDHYSLKKPKERIVEYFAVNQLKEIRKNSTKNGAILCFVGPPGVGKTSLANSIAKALNKELVRIALGGLEDVNELRGHRRTYIGAMAGRIVQGLIDTKSMDPVMVLDEIDKLGRSQRGDPTAVMLEILDPEQNSHFRDYYTNFEIDLSKVLFIATANDISKVPTPLRDRMEIIYIDSYTPMEKFYIAKKYLLPQEIQKHSLKKSEISISDTALKEIIDKYTREAGVRNLRRVIAKIIRKAAIKILKEDIKKVSITIKNLKDFLEKKVFEIEEIEKVDKIGVVNGLAWTAIGGDLLKIEAIKIKGKGGLTLTGSLGDVMKESARIALSVVRVLIDEQKLQVPKIESKEPYYKNFDIHIHFPAGATPKDGPSAGIAIVSVVSSILSNKKIRHDIAMTGEVSLVGDVLPIGGLKEKLIAAYKAKIKEVLIPIKNYERDLDDIPDEVKEGLIITPVKRVEEVLQKTLI